MTATATIGSYHGTYNDSNDFFDDDDLCPICLDNFDIGDTVMWSSSSAASASTSASARISSPPCSKNSTYKCSHVFHKECIMQWLLEQRENECPSRRSSFFTDGNNDSNNNSSTDTNTNTNSTDTDVALGKLPPSAVISSAFASEIQ
ncbi:hypothetical protein FRACYDRAFT_255417 [Fragilariopsis cylindrus CCMP1102]|uniref:RING-type domain-containing protein n=1 Tax=Fragilariopsis cylindrus CCMP1102 TaxID=635003 RepID=A0A1E7EK76_9STRA|nr:hypothetical protein FRACYDRAFT_255417 [Fragilariopsis cylindrus CCMP1102]|eukprot:OEU06274.1 hypothetical protein FRACYDRAFT_255417 [Fragilariopsis cylindrus CCMP1102]